MTSTRNKGDLLMKNRKNFMTILFLIGLTIFAFPLFFQGGKIWAACTDSDKDGICDDLESASNVTLYNGASYPADITGAVKLDPNFRDIFVVVKKATDFVGGNKTYLTSDIDPLAYVNQSLGGKIKVHLIPFTQINDKINDIYNDRLVIQGSSQKAIRIVEDLSSGSDPNIMGISSCGTPNGDDSATIYTQNIINLLAGIYGSELAIPSDVRKKYIQHIIAHEIGHMIGPLAPTYVAKLGGNHYTAGSNTVMDQFVKYKSGIWTIGSTFTTADQNGVKLIP
jgi:hypothetical protein